MMKIKSSGVWKEEDGNCKYIWENEEERGVKDKTEKERVRIIKGGKAVHKKGRVWQRIYWDPDAGEDRGQEEKGVTEGEMVGGHHWIHGHECEQTLGNSEGQGSLACYSPRGPRVGHDRGETTTNAESVRLHGRT